MTDGAVALNNRWLKVQPDITVPAYACVRVTGVSIVDDELIILASKVNEDSMPASKVMFIGNCGINAGQIGIGTYSFPAWALGSGAIEAGSTCGTVSDQFELGIGPYNRGFYCEGSDANRGIIRVKPQPFSEDNDCIPDEPIYSRRYECLKNPYYIDVSSGSYLDTDADSYDCCDWTNPRGYLYEFLDRYEWNEHFCDWRLVPATTPNRKIMCCDPECGDSYNPEICSPCTMSSLSNSGDTCCGGTVDIQATFECDPEQTIRALPTKVWVEGMACTDGTTYALRFCDTDATVLIPGSVQTDANGIADYNYTLTGPACSGEDQLWVYWVKGLVCDEPNAPQHGWNFPLLWKDCSPPDCPTCPQDESQVDHDPATFTLTGTVSGNVKANVTETFTYDEAAGFWKATFSFVAQDALAVPTEEKNLSMCVWIGCDNIAAAGAPGFAGPANTGPIYCEDCATPVSGYAFDNAGGYGGTLTITGGISADDIIDACGGGSNFTNFSTIQLSVTIGSCA